MKLISKVIFFILFSNFLNGQIIEKIVNGQNAQEGEFPWVASIATSSEFFGYVSDTTCGCGGSLIAPNLVLTAAHCVYSPFGPSFDFNIVGVGLNSLINDVDSLEQADNFISAAEVFVHPDFNTSGGTDLALIRLSEEVLIEPIDLAQFSDSTYYSHMQPGKVMGWGITELPNPSEPAEPQDSLLFADVAFYSDEACLELDPCSGYNTPGGTICAGYFVDGSGGGAGSGDSGGPLIFSDDEGLKLVGVVSCGSSEITTPNSPGVYTLIPRYKNWIDSIINLFYPASIFSFNQDNLDFNYLMNEEVLISNLNIDCEYSIVAYDVSGRLIYEDNSYREEKKRISVQPYNSGLYIFFVFDEQKKLLMREKILIQ